MMIRRLVSSTRSSGCATKMMTELPSKFPNAFSKLPYGCGQMFSYMVLLNLRTKCMLFARHLGGVTGGGGGTDSGEGGTDSGGAGGAGSGGAGGGTNGGGGGIPPRGGQAKRTLTLLQKRRKQNARRNKGGAEGNQRWEYRVLEMCISSLLSTSIGYFLVKLYTYYFPNETPIEEWQNDLGKIVSSLDKLVLEIQKIKMFWFPPEVLEDRQIQVILRDPLIRQVLTDFEKNPKTAAEAYSSNPEVMAKVEKLVKAIRALNELEK